MSGVDAVSEAASTEAATPIDRELRVAAAAEQWAEEIADLGGRDTLLHFRDLKVGTLDLAAADPEPRRLLLEGEPVPVSRLFPHEPLRTSAMRSTRALVAKTRELAEERGLHSAYLAIGIATWADLRGPRRTAAPVLLREVTLSPLGGAEGDFVVQAAVPPQINPMLLRTMATDLGIRLAADDLLDAAGELRYVHVVERLREFAPPHVADGFSIAHRVVISTFSTAKLAMLNDLRHAARPMARNDVIAALAEDRLSTVVLREPRRQPTATDVAPALVLDADSDQTGIVTDVLRGSHLVVNAPPGTGRTQTITNLIAALVARDQRVLYVSQKRASLDSVMERLDRVGLADLVLNVPASSQQRAGVAATVAAYLHEQQTAHPRVDELDDAELTELASALRAHRDAAHAPRQPWGVSVYQAEAAVAATSVRARTDVRLSGAALAGLHGAALDDIRTAIRDYAELGGLTLSSASPWHGARVSTRAEARAVGDAVHHLLHNALFACRDATTRAAVEVGLPGPQTPAEAAARTRLLTGIVTTHDQLRPEVWQAPLDELVAATGSAAFRRESAQAGGWWARRKLRRAARELLVVPSQRIGREPLHRLLADASEQLQTWRRLARDNRRPRVGEHLVAAQSAVAKLRQHLDVVAAVLPDGPNLMHLPYNELSRRLVDLAGDESTLEKVPRLTELHSRLVAAGLAELLGDLRKRGSDPIAAAEAVDHVLYASLLAQWHDGGDAGNQFDGVAHDARVAAYRAADHQHLVVTADRIRYLHARQVGRLADDFADQAALVRTEADKDGWQLGLPDLVQAARDVLLEAKPCWFTSPLLVSQVLPPEQLFDVVIIDEASQLPWIHAVPAIARGSQVVVFGDKRQLPPMPFGIAAVPDDVPDSAAPPLPVGPPVSVLDRLASLLPVRSLTGHYRSQDERLIAFANHRFYDDELHTLPAAALDDCVRHVLVAAQHGEGLVDSSTAEVDRVVELAISHARARPHETLGVISFTDKHAERIELALRRALQKAPDVADFFLAAREERFFVKHLDQAQGESRDAVILTLGYGRAADGRVLHRFGPLNHDSGAQRLAVAFTRARVRLTVVSCFTAEELVPWRLNSNGAQALRDFLDYVVAGGEDKSGDLEVSFEGPPDAVRDAVAERLRAAGLRVEALYGRSATRVGLAIRHPRRDDRFVLAVETDGPDYAARPTVRDRDHLHPEWLEHLGWHVHRVWGAAWALDPDREIKRIRDLYERAVREVDEFDAATAAATADRVAGMPVSRSAGQGGLAKPVGRSLMVPRRPVWAYSLPELVGLVTSLPGNGARDESGLMAAALAELGFEPGNPRAEAAIRQAVRVALIARTSPDKPKIGATSAASDSDPSGGVGG